MAAKWNSRPLSASSTESVDLSLAPSPVFTAFNPGICGYDGRQLGAPAPAPNSPWPRMTPSDEQRFVHVFSQVDTDHDGKVTGEQARQLFLSWQLPRGELIIPYSSTNPLLILSGAPWFLCLYDEWHRDAWLQKLRNLQSHQSDNVARFVDLLKLIIFSPQAHSSTQCLCK